LGALLAKLGLTPRKPWQRAYQWDPEAIEARQRETYPANERRPKALGADMFFCDESGFRADTVYGKRGVPGQTGGPPPRAAPAPQSMRRKPSGLAVTRKRLTPNS